MKFYLEIFLTFFKLGLVSFGGGYAMIPLIQSQVESHQWMKMNEFTDVIAISAMAPGPIAANSATIIGYKLSSLGGAIVACIAVTLPSLILILFIGKLFIKYQEHSVVKAAFYGLRATIVGIIAYSALKFALGNGIIGGRNLVDIKSFCIVIISLLILLKTKLHPGYLIAASGALGILLF
jgi:chromate transporter